MAPWQAQDKAVAKFDSRAASSGDHNNRWVGGDTIELMDTHTLSPYLIG